MQILIENSTNNIKYAEAKIVQYANMSLIINGDEVTTVISDMNSDNSHLETISKDSLPADWIGDKYKYENSEFVLNPDYTYWEEVDGIRKHFNYLGEEIVEK